MMCSASSSSSSRTVQTVPAVYYRRAFTKPKENAVHTQCIPRVIEIFIPQLEIGCTVSNPVNAFFTDKPLNIYPIDFNTDISCYTTRPQASKVYVRSALHPIQIPKDLADSIKQVAQLGAACFSERGSKEKENTFERMREFMSRKLEWEITRNIPEKLPTEYETKIELRRSIPHCKTLDCEALDNQCIWYARFRSPDGITLFYASSAEAQKMFDQGRAEIRLTSEDQQYLDDALNSLYANSIPWAKVKYMVAYDAVARNPSDENLKKEKRIAHMLLYKNSTKDAQDKMDFAYYTCFQNMFMQSANYGLRLNIVKAMMKLYADAPEAAQRAFDAAWEDP